MYEKKLKVTLEVLDLVYIKDSETAQCIEQNMMREREKLSVKKVFYFAVLFR